MKTKQIKVNPECMKATVNITDQPKLVIVDAGKVKEVMMPYCGEVIIKTRKGSIQMFDVKEEGVF